MATHGTIKKITVQLTPAQIKLVNNALDYFKYRHPDRNKQEMAKRIMATLTVAMVKFQDRG